jgi:hypothetical protein
VKWILAQSESRETVGQRASVALENLSLVHQHYSRLDVDLMDFVYIDLQDFVSVDSLFSVTEYLVDNGARLTYAMIITTICDRTDNLIHLSAIWQVAIERDLIYTVDGKGLTIIDKLLEANFELVESNSDAVDVSILQMVELFFRHRSVSPCWTSRWLPQAARKSALEVVTSSTEMVRTLPREILTVRTLWTLRDNDSNVCKHSSRARCPIGYMLGRLRHYQGSVRQVERLCNISRQNTCSRTSLLSTGMSGAMAVTR